jgi:hypothetical protein
MEVGLEGNCRSFTGAREGGDHNHVGKDTHFLSANKTKKLTRSSSAASADGSLCKTTENDFDFFSDSSRTLPARPKCLSDPVKHPKNKPLPIYHLRKISILRLRWGSDDVKRRRKALSKVKPKARRMKKPPPVPCRTLLRTRNCTGAPQTRLLDPTT